MYDDDAHEVDDYIPEVDGYIPVLPPWLTPSLDEVPPPLIRDYSMHELFVDVRGVAARRSCADGGSHELIIHFLLLPYVPP
jgi:hypothetical protein